MTASIPPFAAALPHVLTPVCVYMASSSTTTTVIITLSVSRGAASKVSAPTFWNATISALPMANAP
eukprot:CAMPEP_0170560094 /NCGR_PEP_ID=MMETSP0211-20121228/47011_1 /TAXON_ID=311385 /ORGANISM="Pseudokeronopsis sp., Strain OXSARD2" /LENGTH=65 /DNA_ID=CAMNT_0010873901 /DNA_START=100 /DNA_END=297 /DNA_ORIENTATION=+